jgi:hypothetical protein
VRTALAVTLAVAIGSMAVAQPAGTRGTGTDITNADIMAAVAKTPQLPLSDQQIRVVGINNGEYNVGVGVVLRAKTGGRDVGGGTGHGQITEIYHVISGNGTFVTGTIENIKPTPADSPVVTTLNGSSSGGGRVVGGTSRKIGPATS